MWTRDFWKATTERVLRAFFLTLASVWLVGEQTLDLRDIDWGSGLSLAGGTALGSLVLCMVAGLGLGPKGSPSLVRDPAAAGTAPAALRVGEHRRDEHDGHVKRVSPPWAEPRITGSVSTTRTGRIGDAEHDARERDPLT